MEYEVRYGKRKSISISVKKDGRVVVNAPRSSTVEYIDSVLKKHASWIDSARARVLKRAEQYAAITQDEIFSLRKKAREVLIPLTEHYAKIMGLKYGRITITGAKTRYGSCSSKGNISYSYYLMNKDFECLEYVVVHELSHLVYMNHSKEFYRLIERYLPDYRERRKKLKSR